MTRGLEEALAALVLGPALDPDDPAALSGWLDELGLDAESREALNPGALRRLLVYRRLVRETLRGALAGCLPRSLARLGSLADEYFARFLAERGPHTPYLRDVATEFLDFCAPLWAEDLRVPEFLSDLARHELCRIEVGALPSRAAPEQGEFALDRPLRFCETARVVRYSHRVHELSDDLDDRQEPVRQETTLFVYRSPEHVVRYLELTPLAGSILTRLVHRAMPLDQALNQACAERGQAVSPDVLEATASLLSDLAERGALVGAASASAEPGAD